MLLELAFLKKSEDDYQISFTLLLVTAPTKSLELIKG